MTTYGFSLRDGVFRALRQHHQSSEIDDHQARKIAKRLIRANAYGQARAAIGLSGLIWNVWQLVAPCVNRASHLPPT